MKFKMIHYNINVYDLEKSIDFYKQALDLKVFRIKEANDNSFKLAFLNNEHSTFYLELTWLKDQKKPYQLGDNETHLAFSCDNYDQAFKKHKEMNCICYINESMGLYFIEDPDGYWIEILPSK